MGLQPPSSSSSFSYATTGPTWARPVYLLKLTCKGGEASILDCDYEPVEADAAAVCDVIDVQCGAPAQGEQPVVGAPTSGKACSAAT